MIQSWHLVFLRFQGIFYPSHFLTRLCLSFTFWVWVQFAPLFHTGFMASSLGCALPACLAWAWTHPAGMSTCSWRSFPLRTGGQNLISSLSISPYPVEQDALFTPNHSGNLPTAHIWALCMHEFFRKMSSLFSFGGFSEANSFAFY